MVNTTNPTTPRTWIPIAFLGWAAGACAHARPIPREVSEPYYVCQGVSIEDSARRLAEGGWMLRSQSASVIQTEARPAFSAGASLALRVFAGAGASLRVSVVATPTGVRFTPVMGMDMQIAQGGLIQPRTV